MKHREIQSVLDWERVRVTHNQLQTRQKALVTNLAPPKLRTQTAIQT